MYDVLLKKDNDDHDQLMWHMMREYPNDRLPYDVMERKKIVIIMIVWCEKKEDHNNHEQVAVMMIRTIRITTNDEIESPRLRDGSIEIK